MRCDDIMTRDPVSIRASESVAVAIKTMKSRNVGFLPVCDATDAVVGFVTEQHLVRVVVDENIGPATTIETVMGRDVSTCSPDDDVSVAERALEAHPGRCAVCVGSHGEPVGIVGATDLARAGRGAAAAATKPSAY